MNAILICRSTRVYFLCYSNSSQRLPWAAVVSYSVSWLLQNFKEKLFGGKDKENTGFSMPHQYRELEDLLARERMNGKQIQEQLIKARAEIVALRANGQWLAFSL